MNLVQVFLAMIFKFAYCFFFYKMKEITDSSQLYVSRNNILVSC